MNKSKMFLIFLTISLFSNSYEFDCGRFQDATCGGHNTNYELKCHYFTSGCGELETDDNCELDTSNNCVKKSGVEFSDGETCELFTVDYSSLKYCKKVTVDEKCNIDFTEGCVAKDETLAGDEKCVFSSDYKECKKLKKECSDYTDDDTCGGLGIYESGTKQCTMIDGNCNEFEIDEYCKINTETQECEKRDSITLDEEIESCYLDEYRHTCKKRAKSCSDIKNVQKCSSGRTEDDEAQCLKYGEECAEIIIHPSCKVSDDWNSCDSLKTKENKACSFFDGDKTVCWLFEQEEGCKINAENVNCQNAENVPEGKICAYDKDIDDGHFICKIRDIKCKYIKAKDLCNSETQIKDNKEFACSWEENSKDADGEGCSSFDSDEFCIRKNRECVPKDGVILAENEKCELSYENGYNTCQKTFTKSCDTYHDKTECNNAPESNKEQCFYEEGYGCLKVKLDGYCHMSDGICKENGLAN